MECGFVRNHGLGTLRFDSLSIASECGGGNGKLDGIFATEVRKSYLHLLLAHVKTECNYGERVEGGETRCPAYGF